MSRNTKLITIEAEGRDKGKMFEITEMPARAAERWANRVLFALMNGGVEVPENLQSMGLSALIAVGISALGKIPFEKAEPLFEEMLQCLDYIPDPAKHGIKRPYRNFVDSDIEEFTTYYFLRWEIIKLHTDFFTRAKS